MHRKMQRYGSWLSSGPGLVARLFFLTKRRKIYQRQSSRCFMLGRGDCHSERNVLMTTDREISTTLHHYAADIDSVEQATWGIVLSQPGRRNAGLLPIFRTISTVLVKHCVPREFYWTRPHSGVKVCWNSPFRASMHFISFLNISPLVVSVIRKRSK